MALVIGILFAAGTYMILRPNLIRIVLGLGLYSNAANLLLITCGGYSGSALAPFVGSGEVDAAKYMDPLPPDIILTAIVISFAVGALFLTMCYRVYQDHGTDNPEELPNGSDDDSDQAEQSIIVPNVLEDLARENENAPIEPDGSTLKAKHAAGHPA